MSDPRRIQVLDSTSQDYRKAFTTFLAHTDQKVNARAWLLRFIKALPQRRVFLDVGAGNGTVTAWLAPSFERTLAIEPNPALREELIRVCKLHQVMAEPIHAAQPAEPADFILCSHVFYYILIPQWQKTLDTLLSWLAPGGSLVVALQHHESDGMRMVKHFLGQEFNLSALGEESGRAHTDSCEVKVDLVPAHVTAPNLSITYAIAEFMLNTFSMPETPLRSDLETYVQRNFKQADGSYRYSCHQMFLQVPRRA